MIEAALTGDATLDTSAAQQLPQHRAKLREAGLAGRLEKRVEAGDHVLASSRGSGTSQVAHRSTTRPSSSCSLKSQKSSVVSRWAIISVVRPPIKRLIASMIAASVAMSTELVGSSRIRIGASFRKARARET